jgi:hypothetical protein
MRLIAHRGNIKGSNPSLENSPTYIDVALMRGFDAEIDMRIVGGQIYFGHDEPEYRVELAWISDRQESLWVHCKNTEALSFCIEKNIHCFFHNTDDYTITSQGFVWAYPGKPPTSTKCICVMPEKIDKQDLQLYFGICSDNILSVLENLND